MIIKLELSSEEINLILEGLQELQAKKSFHLINKILDFSNKQISQLKPDKKSEDKMEKNS